MVSRSAIAQHYRQDGREKRGYETLADWYEMVAGLDHSKERFDPNIYPYRCRACGLIHGGHPRPTNGREKQRFLESQPDRMELGIRVLAHMGGENHPNVAARSRAIRRRGRRVRG